MPPMEPTPNIAPEATPSHRTVAKLLGQLDGKLETLLTEFEQTGKNIPPNAYDLRKEIQRLETAVNDGAKFDDDLSSRLDGVAESYSSLKNQLGARVYGQDSFGK